MSTDAGSSTVDVGRLLDDGAWTGYQKWLVCLTALTIIFDGADNQLLGAAIPAIMRDWSVAGSALTPVLAVGLAGMLLGGAVAGMAGDRVGRKTALIGSVLVFGLATTAIGLVTNVWELGASRFIAGLGLGGALPNAAALATEFVPRRHRSLAVTLTIVCVPLGGTLAGLLAGRVLPTLGWRALFIIGGVVPVVVSVTLARLLAESPRYLVTRAARHAELVRLMRRVGHLVEGQPVFVDTTEKAVGRAGVGALFTPDYRRDTIALCGAFFSCLLAVYLGFNWIPRMLSGAGLAAIATTGITVFNLGGVAGAIGGALTFARLGSRPTMLTMAAAAAISAVAMRWFPLNASAATLPIIAMLCLIGGLINAVQTTMYALATQVYPTAFRATGVGVAIAIGRVGAILSAYAGDWALTAGGPPMFFLVVGTFMAASLVALASITRHIQSQKPKARRLKPKTSRHT